MVIPGSKLGGAGGSSEGQISHFTECGRVVYQIEGIDEAINRDHFLSKSDEYFFQDGRRKVKMSFFILRFQKSSSHEPLGPG